MHVLVSLFVYLYIFQLSFSYYFVRTCSKSLQLTNNMSFWVVMTFSLVILNKIIVVHCILHSSPPGFFVKFTHQQFASTHFKEVYCLHIFYLNCLFSDAFCYFCILQWSEIVRTCPLCKSSFSSIIHSVKSMDNYQQVHDIMQL